MKHVLAEVLYLIRAAKFIAQTWKANIKKQKKKLSPRILVEWFRVQAATYIVNKSDKINK